MNTPEQSIGHYQLKNLLGAGGMGNVFLGYDPRLERQVAIKCVRLDTNIENGDNYLKKEAKVLAKLNHPNIVQLYDIVEQENQLALVMEYVKGMSFKDVIKNQDYTLKQALTWLSEVSLGLHSAHHHNIIHRDLKPENILLSDDSKVKIADFGIAKLTNAEHHSTHNILGSYIAFSPEQASGKKLDSQTDVFSFGIFAYLLLCRKHPFGDSSEPANIITNILSGGVVPPERENSNIIQPISDLIITLLEKKPENRPHDLHKVSQIFLEHAAQHNHTKIDNIITADTVIEKKHNSKNHTRVLSTSSQHSNFTRAVTTSFKNRYFLYSSIAFATILFAVIFFVLYPSNIENQYIAVMEPKLTTQLDAQKEDYLIKSTVFNAFEQSITNTNGLKLIPRLELSEAGNTPSQVGLQTGADSVLSSHIECFNRSCNITLSRLDSEDWSVVEQKQWSIIKDQFLNTHNISAQRAVGLFVDSAKLKDTHNIIDEETYKRYVEIKYEIASTSNIPESSLHETSSLIERAPSYTPLYDLYGNIALHAYTESNDSHYLDLLESKLNDVPTTISSSQNIIFNWFEFYLTKREYDLAQRQIDILRDKNRDEVKVIEMKASLARAKGNLELAITHFKQALSFRKSRNTLYELAQTYWQQGNLTKTKLQIDTLLALSPNDHFGLSLKAGIALSEGDLKLAQQTYETLLLNNDDSYHYSNLGLVYLLLRKYNDAKILFIKALEQNPKNHALQLNLADIEQILGNKKVAINAYKNILKTLAHTEDMEEMLVLPQVYAQLGPVHTKC